MQMISLKAYLRGEPSTEDIYGASKRLWETEDHGSAALFGATLIDVALTTNLLARLWTDNGSNDEELTGNDGPLSTFSRKIKMAEAMRIIGPRTRANLDTVRTIRNAFAHTHRTLTFDLPAVTELCKRLDSEVFPHPRRFPYVEGGFSPKQQYCLCVIGIWSVLRARVKQVRTGETSWDGNSLVMYWWVDRYPAPLP